MESAVLDNLLMTATFLKKNAISTLAKQGHVNHRVKVHISWLKYKKVYKITF